MALGGTGLLMREPGGLWDRRVCHGVGVQLMGNRVAHEGPGLCIWGAGWLMMNHGGSLNAHGGLLNAQGGSLWAQGDS